MRFLSRVGRLWASADTLIDLTLPYILHLHYNRCLYMSSADHTLEVYHTCIHILYI